MGTMFHLVEGSVPPHAPAREAVSRLISCGPRSLAIPGPDVHRTASRRFAWSHHVKFERLQVMAEVGTREA